MTGGGRKRVFAGLEFRYSGIERRRRRRNGSESYRIAGIDVHKRMLAVVVIDAARENEFEFERRKFGTTVGELGLLAEWLGHQEVREVVMESTAQYWKPVWRNDSACRHRPNPIARPRVDAERLVSGGRVNSELCARSGTAVMAYHDTYQSSIET